MFETAYFDNSPFGRGDVTANSSKLISGKDFYSVNQGGVSQDNPWLTTSQDQGQTYGENGYFGDTTGPQQSFGDYSKDNSWYSGDVYDFGEGKAVPVEFLYGYDKFGIGKSNRNSLYNMVNWDNWKGIEGIQSPDDIAANYWKQHYDANKHGYTDDETSSSGSVVLKNIANDFMNQDYFKNQRNGQEFDISTMPQWDQFSSQSGEIMGKAKAATQAMNAGSGAIISRPLQDFIKSSVMAWLGTGGWGTVGEWAGGAGASGSSTAATSEAASTAAASQGGGQGMDYIDWGGSFDGYDWGTTDWSIPADQTTTNALEVNDWGNASTGNVGGNTGYQGSSPWGASTGGTNMGGWQQVLQQGMKGIQGMGGGGQGNYQMPWASLLTGLMGLYGANKQNQTSRELMDRASGAADPFASQRGFYADKLRQSYENPEALWNSPQWQSLRKRMLQDSTAKDAAAGRLTDFGDRDQRVASSFMGDYLPKMQQGLQAPSGASSNPAAVAQALMAMSGNQINAQNNQSNSLGYLLNALMQGNQPNTLEKIFGGAPMGGNDNLFSMLMKAWGGGQGGSNGMNDVYL